jgi:putative ABC transport system permease protein
MVEQAPGVARDARGPLVAGTLFASVVMENWKPGLFATAGLVGIDTRYLHVIPGFHVTRGRMFRSGLDEAIIGEGAARLYPDLAVGRTLQWNHRSWKIVGAFTAGGGNVDSQFYTSLHQLQTANNAGDQVSGIVARLVSPAAFPAFKRALEHQPGLTVTVETLSQRDQDFGGDLNRILVLADGLITAMMAVGAIFGALNVMYANVASRSAELATLRALGFSRMPILFAVLSEAVVLALIGGGLGVLVAYLLFDGFEASTEAGTLVAFKFAVTVSAVGAALLLTLTMGFLGGLFPAIRAARLPVAVALREG